MNRKLLTLTMNALRYIFEGLLGCAILMCLASFFVFSDREDIIEFNIAASIIAAIGILFNFIAKRIGKYLEKLQ